MAIPADADRVPLAGIRRSISSNLHASLQSTAQVTSFFQIDATALVAARDGYAGRGEPLSFDALMVAAAARALRKVVIVNAHIDGDSIVFPNEVNVGVAVALGEEFAVGGGLVVPVVFAADAKSPPQVEADLSEKVGRARQRRITAADVQGGTFTVSNLGGLPGSAYWRGATPVINGKQGAILAVGRAHDAAVVVDGQVQVRKTLSLALTHDHRLIDGGPAGAFIDALVEELMVSVPGSVLGGVS
jgi:pyruvate/2-oxoglutarate dehydrogenase complex dihydrolipoamide acyltransferase (E2) component